ncbi:sialidase family protein [Paenibacillus sp. FSL H8-0034]|uniref:sialidase family protein n=1 Tax=Paenibacillus sp. FSL H8-0034 TaxID=2954671 RepID=UPI0030F77FE8
MSNTTQQISSRSLYVGSDPYYLVCEPFLRKAPNGELFIFFQSGGHTEPANNNTLFITHSRDKGETWTEPREIITTEGKGTWSSEVFVDDDKITAFVYEVEQDNHFATLRAFRSYSYDSGVTWTPREKFEGFHECHNMRQRIIRSDGAWVIPFCYTEPVNLPEEKPQPAYESSIAPWRAFYQNHLYRSGVLISTDGGLTFSRHVAPGPRSEQFLWEPNVIELSTGELVMLMRNEYNGWLWRSVSRDGGVTWSEAEQTDIPDAAVKMRLLKLADGRIALFCHPNPNIATDPDWLKNSSRTYRYPFELWVSSDDMNTWSVKIDLQHVLPPRREIDLYHYPDGYVDEEDQAIYIAVDLNRNELIAITIPFGALERWG